MSHPIRIPSDLSAIHRFPDEVLLDVFIEHKKCDGGVLVPSRVCQRWRSIIHGYIPFWSTFRLVLQDPEVDLHAAYWIERAREGQLSVTIKEFESRYRFCEITAIDMEASLIRIARLLQAHLHQLASLSIDSHPHFIELFFQHFDSFPPNLNHLSLSASDPVNENDYDNPAFLLNIPFRAPPCVLPKVRLTSKNCIPSFDPSFGQHITDVKLDTFRDEDDDCILNIFQSCPNLALFQLKRLSSARSFSTMRSKDYQFSFPFLITLSISGVRGLENMLSMLSFPSLKYLSLQSFNWSNELSDIVCDALQSCPSLIRLTLNSSHNDPSHPDIPLSYDSPIPLDSLTYLSVSCPKSAESLIRRLRIPRAQELVIQRAPWDIAHHLISSCHQLHKLSLESMQNFNVSPIPVFLPTLESLDVWCSSSDNSCSVHILHAPQLVDLRLRCQCGPHTSVQEFLEQPGMRPSLVTLNLHCNQVIRSKTLMHYRCNSPNLKEINLEFVTLDDLPLTLQDSSSGETFLPKLRLIWGRAADVFIDILRCRHESSLASCTEISLPPVSCNCWRHFTEEQHVAIKVIID